MSNPQTFLKLRTNAIGILLGIPLPKPFIENISLILNNSAQFNLSREGRSDLQLILERLR